MSDEILGHNPLEEGIDSIWKKPKKKPLLVTTPPKNPRSIMEPLPPSNEPPQPLQEEEWLPIDNTGEETGLDDALSLLSENEEALLHENEKNHIDIEKTIQLVGFRLGGELFGIDIMSVQEIIKIVEITRVPNTASYLIGVVNLRGQVIPVIRLRDRFKLNYNRVETDKKRIVIANSDIGAIGFEVDEVTEVFRVSEKIIVPPPPSSTSLDEKLITGVGRIKGQLIIILNIETLIASTEMVT